MNSQLEAIFKALIESATVNGNHGANESALDFIETFLTTRGMHVTRFLIEGYGSLIATTRPSIKTPKLMLAAHLDVVEGSADLFTLRKEDGKFYGRGVLDMKGSIAAYLQIIDTIKDSLDEYDLGIMITTDEESGSLHGVGELLERGYIPQVCVLPDGGDNWQIQLYSKGFLYLTITARGRTAHGSRPWLGESANIHLLHALGDIQKLFPEPSFETKTLNIGMIRGGSAHNQIPDYAEASLDIRLASEHERQDILRDIKEICEQHNAEMEVKISGAVGEFSLDTPLIRQFAHIIEDVTGVKIEGSRTLGSNDARFFPVYNVPCISFYPPGGGHHGPDEWISEEGFYQMYDILSRYTQQVAREVET
jgi:acetylornithine deacetylase/succinyl-diaminopimelate desuccinylase-like protein